VANEIQVRSSLFILADNVRYQSPQQSFSLTMTGRKGPTPSAVYATTDGTDVDLSLLGTPGICEVINQDTANYVVLGRWDSTTSTFYPFMEVGPGENYVFKLPRDILDEYSGTGTGTGSNTSKLRIKAANAPCNVLLLAFER